jgi:hypothetical protein
MILLVNIEKTFRCFRRFRVSFDFLKVLRRIFKNACENIDLYNKNKNFIKDAELKKIDGEIEI